MTAIHSTTRGTIHRARAEQTYPDIADGSVSLVISDGPYNMRKAAWDRHASWDAFRDWYRPHVEAWGRVCASSATVYVWGTDDSASELRPLMREHGWTKRVRIVWDKGAGSLAVVNPGVRPWAETAEYCDAWERGDPTRNKDATCPTSVWRLAPSQYAGERLKGERVVSGCGSWTSLHPCQKPLAFYDRIIRASSRVGDLVLEPFAGTCRAAVACEALPADEARRYVCIEPDEDGRDYLAAVVASLAPPPLFAGAAK